MAEKKGLRKILDGFKGFLLRGNVIDLAVAVVIGGAFNNLINALVKDIITPFIGTFGGKADFSSIIFTIGSNKFFVGDFLDAVISFLITGAVIYFFIVTPMNKFAERLKKPGEAPSASPSEKICPECLSQIPVNAIRCKYCTAVLSS